MAPEAAFVGYRCSAGAACWAGVEGKGRAEGYGDSKQEAALQDKIR